MTPTNDTPPAAAPLEARLASLAVVIAATARELRLDPAALSPERLRLAGLAAVAVADAAALLLAAVDRAIDRGGQREDENAPETADG